MNEVRNKSLLEEVSALYLKHNIFEVIQFLCSRKSQCNFRDMLWLALDQENTEAVKHLIQFVTEIDNDFMLLTIAGSSDEIFDLMFKKPGIKAQLMCPGSDSKHYIQRMEKVFQPEWSITDYPFKYCEQCSDFAIDHYSDNKKLALLEKNLTVALELKIIWSLQKLPAEPTKSFSDLLCFRERVPSAFIKANIEPEKLHLYFIYTRAHKHRDLDYYCFLLTEKTKNYSFEKLQALMSAFVTCRRSDFALVVLELIKKILKRFFLQ